MAEEFNPLSLYFDNHIPFSDFVGLFLAINELYKSLGGDALQVNNIEELHRVTEAESAFEQHTGTPFANMAVRLHQSPFDPYMSRKEAYSTINEYAKPEKSKQIREELDKRYPTKTWDGQFPIAGVCQVLLNEHIDDLISK
jgi:hypothetical protein